MCFATLGWTFVCPQLLAGQGSSPEVQAADGTIDPYRVTNDNKDDIDNKA